MNAWSPIIPGKQCPSCHGLFFGDEIAAHADLCAENSQRFSFLGFMESSPLTLQPLKFQIYQMRKYQVCAMPEPYKAVLPLSDILRPLIHVLYEAKPAMENSKPVSAFAVFTGLHSIKPCLS